MQSKQIISVAVAALMLTACNQQMGQPGQGVMSGGNVNKQDIGTAAGAIGGGVLGYQFGGGAGKALSTVAGTVIGGMIGSSIGGSLDNADAALANQKGQYALETAQPGQTLPWKGKNASGSYTPSAYYQNSSGQYCREFTQTINVGGKTDKAYGTACRQPDGTWQIVQ